METWFLKNHLFYQKSIRNIHCTFQHMHLILIPVSSSWGFFVVILVYRLVILRLHINDGGNVVRGVYLPWNDVFL